MHVSPATPDPTPRHHHLGAKLLTGYLPATTLGLLAITFVIASSRSWAAVLGGGVILAIWSAQLALTNFAILALRFERGFVLRALAVSAASALLLPAVAQVEHQLRWWRMGKPDVAGFLQRSTNARCALVGTERLMRIRDSNAYAAEATIRCAGESRDRTCKWTLWYDRSRGQWRDPPPVALSCAAVSSSRPAGASAST